jgi:CubicO group peptidase (beta-lactamase class C family)
MLANMTAGYSDFVPNQTFQEAFYADPFRSWTSDELLTFGFERPRSFAPGANWDYSHANIVILGRLLEVVGGQPLANLLDQYVLAPLGLTHTVGAQTAAIPDPVLHAFSSERRSALGIPDGQRFYEESTFWNPSWTLSPGSVQTTTITDMTTTARAIGEGILLSPESHREQISPSLVGFGAPLEGCLTCHTLTEDYSYGLGVVLSGEWILQNPLFGGYSAITAYLPSRQLAIAAATTFAEGAFDDTGGFVYPRASWRIFAAIAAYLAPEAAPVATRE